MKKIALVYDAIYPYIKGGGEKRFYEMGKRLSKKGYEVHFYGMKLWKGPTVIKKEGMYYHGICKEIPLYENKKRTISQALSFGLASFKLLKEDFDIIDCCGFPYFSLFPVKLACIIKRKPLHATWHEVWGKEYWKSYIGKKGIFGYWVERLASKLPNKIISVSEDTKNKLDNILKVSKEKITTIPNAIDFDKINKIKQSKESSDIIYAGRLINHKNIDMLIKSISIIKKKNPKIKAIIIGDGPELKNLKKLSKELHLEKNIEFKGFIKDYDKVISLIKSSKVFVLPSTREGFGIVVIEANACGIPVITINHKDNASRFLIKDNKNGFLSNLNTNSLSKAIIKSLAAHNSMKLSCKTESMSYDWPKVITSFEEVYR